MRVHRLIQILMKINQEGKVKARDMAEALEVSCRTIYRDIDVLCEAGYPIITTTGQNGGVSFVDDYKLDLDQTDATLKTLFTHLYAMPEQERLIDALENGMNLKYMSADKLSNENIQKILIDKKSWWEEASTDIDLQPIMKALFLQQKLKIQYTQSDRTKTDRIVSPYGLVLKYTSWYLVAYCDCRHEVRTFNCSRIKCVALLQELFVITDDFDLKNYWDYSIKAFKKSKNESEYYPVEIILNVTYSSMLDNYDIISIKRVGDTVTAVIDFHRKDAAEECIRSLICYGLILYPYEMKIRAKEILESSIEVYNLTS